MEVAVEEALDEVERRVRACGQCRQPGHDRRNCPQNVDQQDGRRNEANRGRGGRGRGRGRGTPPHIEIEQPGLIVDPELNIEDVNEGNEEDLDPVDQGGDGDEEVPLDLNGNPIFDANNLVWTEVSMEEIGQCPIDPVTGKYDSDHGKPHFNGPFIKGRHREEVLSQFNLQNELDYWLLYHPENPVLSNFVQWTNAYGRKFVRGWIIGQRNYDIKQQYLESLFILLLG